MPVCELLRRMSASEFAEWMLIDQKFDPFGSTREDLRAGSIASPLINIQLAKGSRATKPSDWILDLTPVKPQSTKQMQMVFKALAESYKKPPEAKPPPTPLVRQPKRKKR